MDFFGLASGGWRHRSGKISPDEYRRLRAACVAMAMQSKAPDERIRWLGMAQSIADLIYCAASKAPICVGRHNVVKGPVLNNGGAAGNLRPQLPAAQQDKTAGHAELPRQEAV